MLRVFALSLVFGLLAATACSETLYKVKVKLSSAEEAQRLVESDLNVLSCHVHLPMTDVAVSESEFLTLASLGLSFEIEGKLDVPMPLPTSSEADDYTTNYLRYSNMLAVYDELMAENPGWMTRTQIGTSIQSRPIYAYRISNPRVPANLKRQVVISTLTHAREWITGSSGMYIAETLLDLAKKTKFYASALNRNEVVIVPCLNPDGYEYTFTSSSTRLWRKNRRNNGSGRYGVDLNRNFPTGWGGSGSSSNPSSDTYRGTAALSEPETAAYAQFMGSLNRPLGVIDFHSYSQLVIWPWGYTTATIPEPDRLRHSNLAQTMVNQLQSKNNVAYTQGQTAVILYLASGGSKDHWYATEGCTSYTVELRDTGQFGFLLPESQIPATIQDAWVCFDLLYRHAVSQP